MNDTNPTPDAHSPQGAEPMKNWQDYTTDEVDQLIALVANIGTPVTVTEPGRVLLDVDGYPSAVTASTKTVADLAGVYLAPSQWEAMARRLIHRHITGAADDDA